MLSLLLTSSFTCISILSIDNQGLHILEGTLCVETISYLVMYYVLFRLSTKSYCFDLKPIRLPLGSTLLALNYFQSIGLLHHLCDYLTAKVRVSFRQSLNTYHIITNTLFRLGISILLSYNLGTSLRRLPIYIYQCFYYAYWKHYSISITVYFYL